MSKLEDLYNTTPPATSKINKNGTDKTPISVDGGKDLAGDDAAVTKARNGDLGGGADGYTPVKRYSDSVLDK